jgi:ABC-type dipeptide/oligopeptide/nickel transport system permease subunit
LALAAIFAPRLAPYEPLAGRLSDILLPPAWMDGGSGAHLLGTDKLGRDEVSRLIYGTRVSLAAGLSAAVIAAVIGVPLGVVGGYMGGRVDSAIAVALNIVLGFPFILLALLIAAVVGPGFRNVIVILGVAGWPIYTRVIRAQVLELRERDFVKLARAMGLSHRRIMLRHVLPGVWATFLVIASLQVGQMILAESFLSFLGLGVQPPQPSWGGMLSDGRSLIFTHGWLTFFPGLAIFVTVLSVNLLGDGLRDGLDTEFDFERTTPTGDVVRVAKPESKE